MLEPIGLIARLDRLGRASRAQSTGTVRGVCIRAFYGTSRQAERQFKRAFPWRVCKRQRNAGMGSGPPKRRKGEPAAASRPAWQKASIKGRLEGQGGQPGVPNILYPFRFTQKRDSAITEKQGSLEAAPRTHTRLSGVVAAFCPVS